ncbi:hypothetical protein ACERK3_16930 [Phycisphaerales bacterium AB-hyl4]|uniref:Uncharacterized protein n=1 Tax=Natronomicrosphaera hydrolytica TaxID=3242702 RepID=A0ABV4UAR3_9BACT
MTAIDATAKYADQLGINIEKLQAYRHAANLAGVGQSQFDSSLQRMQRNIGDAARGIGSAGGAIDDLRLDVRRLARMSPDEQFAEIAEAIAGVENHSIKASAAYQIFGRAGIDMLNVLNQGKAGLSAASAEVDRFGGAVNRVDAAKVELANDAFTRLGLRVKLASQSFAVQFMPWIEAAVSELTEFGTEGKDAGEHVADAMETAAKGVAVVSDGLLIGVAAWGAWRLGATTATEAAVTGLRAAERGLNLASGAMGREVKTSSMVDFFAKLLGMDSASNMKRATDAVSDINKALEDFKGGKASSAVMEIFDGIRADAEKRAQYIADAADERAAQSRASADFLNSLKAEADDARSLRAKPLQVDMGPLSLTEVGSAESHRMAFAAMADSIRAGVPDEQKQQLEEQRKGNTLLTDMGRSLRAMADQLRVVGIGQ